MGDDDPNVSWRDYMTAVIAKETGVLLARLDGMDRARDLQAQELARRLDDLNHAHEKAVEDRQDFVTQATFGQVQAEWNRFRETVLATLAENRGRDTVVTTLVAAAVSLLIAGVTLFGRYLLGGRG